MKRIATTLFLTFFIFTLSAQVQLRVKDLMNFPDTAILDSNTYDFTVVVENNGNQQYNGSIWVRYRVDNKKVFKAMNWDTTASFIIDPGKSANLYVTDFIFESGTFTDGIDIVVIWPEFGNTGGLHGDSLKDSVFLKDYLLTGTREQIKENKEYKVYPTPARAFFRISISPEEIKEVKLFSIHGKAIRTWKTTQPVYYTGSLPPGNYFIEVKTRGNQLIKKKLIITD